MTRAFAHLIAVLATLQTRVEGDKDRGASAVEYGLLVGVLAIAIVAGAALLGPAIQQNLTDIANNL